MRFFLLGAFLLCTSTLIAAPAQKPIPAPPPQPKGPIAPSSPQQKEKSLQSLPAGCDCTTLIACQGLLCAPSLGLGCSTE